MRAISARWSAPESYGGTGTPPALSLYEPDSRMSGGVGARRLWRGTTSLRFILDERSSFSRCEHFGKLVKLVIHLRGDSPLVKFEINAYPDDETEGTYTNTMQLIEYALACQVKVLFVRAVQIEAYPLTFDAPLVSQHLKTIELERVTLNAPL
ncbi:Peptide transporter PTR2 [Hordeum vulgare]|nr:Peptide transporter PTR2 [Hordeum vulgare]